MSENREQPGRGYVTCHTCDGKGREETPITPTLAEIEAKAGEIGQTQFCAFVKLHSDRFDNDGWKISLEKGEFEWWHCEEEDINERNRRRAMRLLEVE